MYLPRRMKKGTKLILIYVLGVMVIVALVKVARVGFESKAEGVTLADCNDSPPTTNPGE